MSHATLVQTQPGQFEFRLPDLGEGVLEGEVVKWLVKEGDAVTEDQPVLEIMTDKATMEIPSPKTGTIKQLLLAEGQMAKVGGGLLIIAAEGAAAAAEGGSEAAAPAAEAPMAAAPAAAAPAPAAAPAAAAASEGPVLAAPATRKLARELGVELATVAGTGPHGRVTREDVRLAAEGGRPAPAAAAPAAGAARASVPAAQPIVAEGEVERIPVRGLRRKIAEKMVQSAYTAPHVTTFDEVDMTALIELRNRLKPKAEAQGVKLSYMPFIMKAVMAAFRQFPLFNASMDDTTGEIVVKKYVHMGFAADTDNGLMVPVIRNAHTKTLFQIAREIPELAARTREGKASKEELSGSSFTVSNVGSVGGLFATPIINYPEVAILGVNKIQKRPVVVGDQLVVKDMMYLGLSFDHRVIDGADAVRFLNTVIGYLQDPELLFAEM